MAMMWDDDALSREGAEFVFASRRADRDHLARHGLTSAFARLIGGLEADGPDAEVVARLKADRPTPHDCRRTVATGLAKLGIVREDRRAVLAHAPSDVHGRVYDQHDRLAEKRIALAVGRAPPWVISLVEPDAEQKLSRPSRKGHARIERRPPKQLTPERAAEPNAGRHLGVRT
jgi:hypothetical protein